MEVLKTDHDLVLQVEAHTTIENAHEVRQVLFLYMACVEVSEDAVREGRPRLYRRVLHKFQVCEKALKHFVGQKGGSLTREGGI